jgi:hypothetical protein
MAKRISHSWIQANNAGREYQFRKAIGDKKGMELAKRRMDYHLNNVVGLGKKNLKKVM